MVLYITKMMFGQVPGWGVGMMLGLGTFSQIASRASLRYAYAIRTDAVQSDSFLVGAMAGSQAWQFPRG